MKHHIVVNSHEYHVLNNYLHSMLAKPIYSKSDKKYQLKTPSIELDSTELAVLKNVHNKILNAKSTLEKLEL
jgi:ATP-dependent Lon protease